MKAGMKFWIDIVNSPHVHFFKPLMEKLIAQGHDVQVTARDSTRDHYLRRIQR